MKNKFYLICIFLIFSLINFSNLNSEEIFNFNVSEIELTENGNIIKGYNGGEAYTNDGISISANNFEYNKIKTFLVASENVKLNDREQNLKITADEISYQKNNENIVARGNVIIIDDEKNILIKANEILYLKDLEEIVASGKVFLNDKDNDIIIKTEKISYLKKISKIHTEGITTAEVHSKYNFESKDVIFLEDKKELLSSKNTVIKDKYFSLYKLDSFVYEIENEFLKGSKVEIIENYNLDDGENNNYFFESGFFDLKKKIYKTGPTKISLKKNIFDRSENDPRLLGVSSVYKNGVTTVKKAIFTSCSKDNKCPPWSIESSEIKHDKNKKQLIYENSILKLYDFPIFYFPKFFHPDPTVNRQSGFLVPKLNNSNTLGSSVSLPYFHIISDNKDFTLNPTIYSKNTQIIQSEYRQENEKSSFIADFGFVNNFKSSVTQKKKNINHLFANFKKNLNLPNFLKSDFNFDLERMTKDTYLKIFSDNLLENKIKPQNVDILESGFDISLEAEKFTFNGGGKLYEDLTKLQSDRYQYVMPYYDYTHAPFSNRYGLLNFSSSGDNVIDNTNNVKSTIINDINFKTNSKIFNNLGIVNNLNFYFKNLNSVGKNVSNYKTSPQIELQSLVELNSELPLFRKLNNKNETLLPRMSIRINPGEMKNYADTERKVNTGNIFDINRLGIDDSLESGNSVTLGVEYKNESESDSEKFLELKIASVFRDDNERNIPSQTTLNNKNSNIFGSVDYSLSKNLSIDYNFAIDNKVENFEYNSIGLDLSLNNFVTKFRFIEEESSLGNTNVFENSIKYGLNENSSFEFKTRRNREINLTEYYNLVYEYKNDCLTAGIRFNKSYYEDRDLKPSENLMFTISFFPITTIEQTLK
tara:strand:+ start:632 stop:3253 length:2622 start_codon:yes stop_codon:yes gene_type:complete